MSRRRLDAAAVLLRACGGFVLGVVVLLITVNPSASASTSSAQRDFEVFPPEAWSPSESSSPAPSDAQVAELTQQAALATASPQRSFLTPAAEEAEPQLFGLTGSNAYFASEPDWEAIARAGATTFRAEFNWFILQERGWENSYERWVEGAAKHGITLIPYLVGRKTSTKNAQFYSSNESEKAEKIEWLGYVREVVKRFGESGTFWSAHPTVPPHPIRVWEVWNEPNNGAYSPGGVPHPQIYAEFLEATSRAIRAQQTEQQPKNTTKVLFGGLLTTFPTTAEEKEKEMRVKDFLELALQNSSTLEAFDGLALHPYAFGTTSSTEHERVNKVIEHVAEARLVLSEDGGALKTMWLTELGWPVEGTGQTTVSEAEQAQLLTDTFDYFKEEYAPFRLKFIAYYFYRDIDIPTWDYHTGLRKKAEPAAEERTTGFFRPAWYAYQAEAAKPRWPVPPRLGTGAVQPEQYSATVSALVHPEGLPTFVEVEVGPTTAYGKAVKLSPFGACQEQSEQAVIEGLSPSTLYHYRYKAVNENGEAVQSADSTFTTAPAEAPTLGEQGAEVHNGTVMFYGRINPQGASSSYHVELGSTTSYGTNVPATDATVGRGFSSLRVETSDPGLPREQIVHYRIVASNQSGTIKGPDNELKIPDTPSNTELPSLSAPPPKEGVEIYATGGKWTNAPTRTSVRILRCDTAGNGCEIAHGGGEGRFYIPSAADVGHTLRVEELVGNAGGEATAISAATPLVLGRGTLLREISLPTGSEPTQILPGSGGFSNTGSVLFANIGKDTVGTFQEASNTLTEYEPAIGGSLLGVAGEPDESEIFSIAAGQERFNSMLPTNEEVPFPYGEPSAIYRYYGLWFAANESSSLYHRDWWGDWSTVPVPGSGGAFVGFSPQNGYNSENLWFATDGCALEATLECLVGRIVANENDAVETFAIPYAPTAMSIDEERNYVWLTVSSPRSLLLKCTFAGECSEVPLPEGAKPEGITFGPDKSMWFTEEGIDKIGAVLPDGELKQFSLPAGSRPAGITADRYIWFTERGSGRLGSMAP